VGVKCGWVRIVDTKMKNKKNYCGFSLEYCHKFIFNSVIILRNDLFSMFDSGKNQTAYSIVPRGEKEVLKKSYIRGGGVKSSYFSKVTVKILTC